MFMLVMDLSKIILSYLSLLIGLLSERLKKLLILLKGLMLLSLFASRIYLNPKEINLYYLGLVCLIDLKMK
jgi:hypothetical protein